MIKTLKNVKQNDKVPMKKLKSVQNSIPLEEFSSEGIFLIQKNGKNNNKYSATFLIRDISYLNLSTEMQRKVFFAWSSVQNSLYPGSTAKFSVIKHKISNDTIESFLMKNTNPQFAEIQADYNRILRQKALEGNGMVQEVYVTISVNKRDFASAQSFFARTKSTLQKELAKMDSICTQLDGKQRLDLLYSVYNPDKENDPLFDLEQTLKTGSTAKNFIAPDSMEFFPDYFKLGDTYGRALVLHSYPNYLRDSIVSEICEINTPLIWSMDVIPIPTDEAVNEAEKRASSVESNIAKWYQKQANNKNFGAILPYDMQQQRAQAKEYLDDLTERDQHLMYVVATLVHFSDSKKQLDEDTETILTSARTARSKMDILRFQQLDGFNTALPLGVRRIEDIMTLTTEGVAGFIPFKSVEIQEKNGFCFGQNQISKNLILINPKNQESANTVILGKPGTGKSFLAKWVFTSKVLASADNKNEVVIIDPEREFSPLVKELGGEVIYLSADSPSHINAMDVKSGYAKDDNPIIIKSQFMLSLCEQLMYPEVLGAKEKSIIDRCTGIVLKDYVRNGCQGTAPTLMDFHQCLLEQPEEEAHNIALSIETYAKGSLSTFAHQTNVDINKRIVCFDINALSENLRQVAMLILTDHIQNRMVNNRANGITMSVLADEFFTHLRKEYTAEFFFNAWKRGRKYDCDYTGITQNIEDLYRNEIGRTILSTSEFVIMLRQSELDRAKLSSILGINENLQEYLSALKTGSGLIKFGENIIPFENEIPKDTLIYKLLTTKPSEAVYSASM